MKLKEIFGTKKETLIWEDSQNQDVRGKELATLLALIQKHGPENLALMYDDRGMGLYLLS
jgi:hypothetical protein